MTGKESKIFDLANAAIDSIDNHYFANSPSYDLAMRVRRKLREIIDMVNPDEENER